MILILFALNKLNTGTFLFKILFLLKYIVNLKHIFNGSMKATEFPGEKENYNELSILITFDGQLERNNHLSL